LLEARLSSSSGPPEPRTCTCTPCLLQVAAAAATGAREAAHSSASSVDLRFNSTPWSRRQDGREPQQQNRAEPKRSRQGILPEPALRRELRVPTDCSATMVIDRTRRIHLSICATPAHCL